MWFGYTIAFNGHLGNSGQLQRFGKSKPRLGEFFSLVQIFSPEIFMCSTGTNVLRLLSANAKDDCAVVTFHVERERKPRARYLRLCFSQHVFASKRLFKLRHRLSHALLGSFRPQTLLTDERNYQENGPFMLLYHGQQTYIE